MPDKCLDLQDAVRRYVEPGASVHFSFTHNRSHAIAYELARTFRGTRSLELVGTGLLDYAIVLAAAGAVTRSISAFAGSTYPSAAPSPPAQALATAAGSDPNWTNLTITLRLMAAALGLPAIPAHSLLSTDLERGPGRAVVENPFTGGSITLLEPLRPDVAFLHVPLADTDGNALVQGPLGEDLWGAWAADRLIVSAEEVVSPERLHEIAPMAGMPASCVDAVVPAPYGAHPQAQFVWDSRLPLRSYAEDYEFRDGLRAAARAPEALDAWLHEWVFGVDHQGYLEKLGHERLEALHLAAAAPGTASSGAAPAETTPSERTAVVAYRWLCEKLRRERRPNRPLFAGIGLSHLVAFAAARQAARDGTPVELVAEVGLVGFAPVDGDPYIFNAANAATSAVHLDFMRTLGGIGGPRERGTIAVLAAGVVDRHGRINSSFDDDGQFIVGSGGANDLAAGAAEVLLVVPLSERRTTAKLSFVTACPERLAAVATDLGVLEPGPDGELRLTQVVAENGRIGEAVDAARSACGWPLRVADTVVSVAAPTCAEVELLRALDPQRRLLR